MTKQDETPCAGGMRRQEALDLLSRMITVFEEIEAADTRVQHTPEALKKGLGRDLELPSGQQSLAEVEKRLETLVRLTPSCSDGRSYSQLFSGRDWAGVCGDMLVPVLNHTLATFRSAGPHVFVEDILVKKMAERMGLDAESVDGTFSPGGSLSNVIALLLARDVAEPTARSRGVRVEHGLYTSCEAHYSVRKASAIVGLGRDTVRRIASDDNGRMCTDALRERMQQDKEAGVLPTIIIATAGTSVQGAFDPIRGLSAIAKEFGAWLHVDAAFGGAACLVPELRKTLFDGIELADSITWDAHKTMGVPITSSVLLVNNRPGRLEASLDEAATYLFGGSNGLNPGRKSMLCGRRNDVLKLWLAWQVYGDEGYERRVRTLRSHVGRAVERVGSSKHLRLLRTPQWMNVCIEVVSTDENKGGKGEKQSFDAAALCASLEDQYGEIVGHASVGGVCCVRLVLTDPDRGVEGVDTLFDHIDLICEKAAAM